MGMCLWGRTGLLLLAGLVLALVVQPCAAAEPARVIFDTDLGADIDDALALAILHAGQSRGVCRLLAVTLTNDNPRVAPLVDAINTFYGRPEIPIGAARNGIGPVNRYVEIAQDFPHKVRSGKDLPDAVTVLRRTLAAQPDGSVTIVQVGQSSNLAALLGTGPDALSPLSGPELAKRKVRLLSIMGGAFVPVEGKEHYAEYNIKSDLPASRRLAAEWPTPIVWSGFEIGLAIPYPAASIEHDFGYVAHHPIAKAYRMYAKMPFDRPTWDLTAVLYALYPDRGYFDLSPPGRVTVAADASTHFKTEDRAPHRYLILRPGQRERALEALVQLTSQPPASRPANHPR
jgi:purine nucleosidase